MKTLYVYFFLIYFPSMQIVAQKNKNKEELESCDTYMLNAHYEKAIDCLSRGKQTKENLQKLIVCYKTIQNYTKGITILSQYLEQNPSDIQFQIELANLYQDNMEFHKSLNIYKNLCEKDSSNTYFLFRQAEIYYQLQNYNEALGCYRRLTNTSNNLSSYFRGMANCFEKTQQRDSSKFYYKKSFDLNSFDFQTVSSLIKINILDEEFDEAINLANTYIENDSTNETINMLKAYSLYKGNKFNLAIPELTKCFENGNENILVVQSLGMSYFKIGQDSLSKIYLEKAYAKDTTSTNVLYTLALVNRDLGNYEETITQSKKLLDRTLPTQGLLFLFYELLGKSQILNKDYTPAIENMLIALYYANEIKSINLLCDIADAYEYYLDDKFQTIHYLKRAISALEEYRAKLVSEGDTDLQFIDEKLTICKKRLEKLDTGVKKGK